MFVGNIRIIDGSYVGQIPSEPFLVQILMGNATTNQALAMANEELLIKQSTPQN